MRLAHKVGLPINEFLCAAAMACFLSTVTLGTSALFAKGMEIMTNSSYWQARTKLCFGGSLVGLSGLITTGFIKAAFELSTSEHE